VRPSEKPAGYVSIPTPSKSINCAASFRPAPNSEVALSHRPRASTDKTHGMKS
jgi:hypothetical protein